MTMRLFQQPRQSRAREDSDSDAIFNEAQKGDETRQRAVMTSWEGDVNTEHSAGKIWIRQGNAGDIREYVDEQSKKKTLGIKARQKGTQ